MMIVRVLVVALLCACSASVRAQTAGARTTDSAAHGWAIVPAPVENATRLAHLPPRRTGGVNLGVARLVTQFAGGPLFAAASGDRVFLLFPPSDGGLTHRVLTLRAVPSPVQNNWAFLPRDGADILAPLETGAAVLGFAATRDERLFALLDDGEPRLVTVGESAGEIALPGFEPTRLVGDGERLALISIEPGRVRWSIGELGGDGVRWSSAAEVADSLGRDDEVFLTREGLFAASVADGRASIRLLRSGGSMPIAEVEVGPSVRVVSLPAARGRVVLLSRADEDEVRLVGPYRSAEVSLIDGSVLYEGPVRRDLPVSPNEFRLLALGLLGLMATALVICLRPAPEDRPVVLPEGTALAEPSRRFAASGVDLLIAAVIAGRLYGVGPIQVLTFQVLLRGDESWQAIPMTPVIGCVIGTLLEATLGGTIGKLLSQCRVVSSEPGNRSIGLLRSLTRNVVKWALPPVAVLAIGDRSGRHRGDAMARAVVVVRVDAEHASDNDG